MSKVKQLPKRDELPVELTWDLSRIFSSDSEFEETFKIVNQEIQKLSDYKGTLKEGSQQLYKVINDILNTSRRLEVLYVYAHLKNDQDTADSKYQAMISKATTLYANFSEQVAWFDPEVIELETDVIERYLSENEDLQVYRHYLEQLTNKSDHILSKDQESLLASASEFLDASSDIFSVLNNADLQFPEVLDDKGERVQLSHGLYGQLMESTNRDVRKDAFQSLYKVYKQFQHTLASTLGYHVKYHNFNAKVRKYSTALEASLSQNKIPESVYRNLIEVVNKKQYLLHRYVKLRKKLLNLQELHMYDMYTPILGDGSYKFTYEEAKKIVLKALKPLGDDYLDVVKLAFENRWIDVVENQGKRSGAYSSGVYDTDPYILMNWHDSLDQMFTLAHEMGHSMHSYLTINNQPYVYGDYSIFLAEIASTTNENLLTEYLLQNESDLHKKAAILNHYLDGFKGTVFRQTQFAEFELFIHESDQKGIPLTSDYLNDYYAKLNQKYYGPDVVNDEEISLEWSRIPHFYYNFYVYQYATGFSAASALTKHILNEGDLAVERYKNFLKSGSSDYPIEIMKKSGIDMTDTTYLYDAMDMFEQRLNELEIVLEQLDIK